MAKNKRKVTLLDILKIMFKRVRLRTLILLIITSAATSFAWFIYSTKVTTGLTAHIESWHIMFTSSDNELSEYVDFTIPNLYPGMDDYSDQIEIENKGERSASVTYEVTTIRVIDTTYTVYGNITSDYLIDRLENYYPFHITFDLENETIGAETGITTFTLNAEWPYESGDDDSDTYYGNLSYAYSQNNPGSPSVSITVKITASQDTP